MSSTMKGWLKSNAVGLVGFLVMGVGGAYAIGESQAANRARDDAMAKDILRLETEAKERAAQIDNLCVRFEGVAVRLEVVAKQLEKVRWQ